MKRRIIIAAAFTVCLALWAAVSPQIEMVVQTPTPIPTPAVATLQPTFPQPKELAVPIIAEGEQAKVPEATTAPEVTIEEPPAPEPTEAGKQTKTEPVQSTQSEPEPTPESETEPEIINGSSGDMVYVPGFGWLESQGSNHVEYAEDMYENGNKIGIMG